jgi:hypothetical protein
MRKLKSGAKAVTGSSVRWAIAGWLLVVTGAATLLNSPMMFPTPRIWMRTLPPILLLFGVFAELNSKVRYRVVLAAIGGWLFLLVVFLYVFVPDRDAYALAGRIPHVGDDVPIASLQLLFFAVLVIIWVHWRIRQIRLSRTIG